MDLGLLVPEAKDDGSGGAKFQSNRHHQQTNTQLFTGRMPFQSPKKQYHEHWREIRADYIVNEIQRLKARPGQAKSK